MNQQPQVTVVIPCYNQAHYLPEAVASVVGQTYAAWELVIVDDGSTDTTAAIARQLITNYPTHAIRLLSQPNQGLGPSRNAGVNIAQGEYILPLDADDMLEPELLAATTAVLAAHPAVGFVYTDVHMFGVETTIWSGGSYRLQKLLLDNPMMPATLFRRQGWLDVGGFRADMQPQGYEDWDFWLSLAEVGWQGFHLARPLLRYRRTNNSMLATARQHDLELRAQLICRHPALYPPAMLRWAQASCHSPVMQYGRFMTRRAWLRAFVGYTMLIARYFPAALAKTLVRPLFVLLSAHQQGYARQFARALRLTQGR